jgi:hypothetical protein
VLTGVAGCVPEVLELLPSERYVTAVDSLDEVSWSAAHEALSRGGSEAGVFEDLFAEEVHRLLQAGQLIECSRGQMIVGETQGATVVSASHSPTALTASVATPRRREQPGRTARGAENPSPRPRG